MAIKWRTTKKRGGFMLMNLEELKQDCARKQKKGLHFILGSIVIWALVAIIHMTNLPILTKNMLTFCATAPLVPIAYIISKLIKVEFSDKKNPLNQLGLLFSINQMIYLLIAMWVYPTVPDKMVMVIAMIFGAHLLPYAWLYTSKIYGVMSIIVPISALIVSYNFEVYVLAILMVIYEIIFSLILEMEVKKMARI
jgi:hypothetical protein